MEEVFVEIACPVCAGRDFRNIVQITPDEFLNDFRKEYYNLDALEIALDTVFYIKQCKKCTFVMLNPRFNDNFYGIVYNEAKQGQFDKNEWIYNDCDLQKLYNTHSKYYAAINLLESIIHIKQRFQKAKNVNHKPIRLLDYGCGFGHILDLCTVFGIEAKGVEIDDIRLKYCLAKGLDVCKPEDLSEEEKFDVVISMNVVEHVNDLNDYFSFIVRRLPVGGVFSFTGLTSKVIYLDIRRKKYKNFMPLEHINYFTPKSIELMTAKYNLAKIPAVKMVQPIEKFTHLFYPLAKTYYRGFYPTGGLKMQLVKVLD